MVSRSLLIIAPVIALTVACTTGEGDGKTDSTKQTLCTVNCDSTTSTSYVKGDFTTTTDKGSYAPPPGDPPPDKVAGDEPFACDCAHTGPNGLPLQLQYGPTPSGNSEWYCVERPKDCCVANPTSDPFATYKQSTSDPQDPSWPPIDTVGDPNDTCGPSGYTSSYNPCVAYPWAPYRVCNWNGCWCSSSP